MINLTTKPRLFFLAGLAAVAHSTVFADTVWVEGAAGNCNGETPCFNTFAAAVAAVTLPADIRIFPGTYNEQLNLDPLDPGNGSGGEITVQSLSPLGTPQIGTVTITAPDDGLVNEFPADLTVIGLNLINNDGDGINLTNPGDILFQDITVTGNDGDGIDMEHESSATIRIEGADLSLNTGKGFGWEYDPDIEGVSDTFDFFIIDVIANNNPEDYGIRIDADPDSADEELITINAVLRNVTASKNGTNDETDGILIYAYNGRVIGSSIVVNGNGQDGIDIEQADRVVLYDVSANNNGSGDDDTDDGIEIDGRVSVSGFALVATGNGAQGIEIEGWAPGNAVDDNPTPVLGNVTLGCVRTSGNYNGVALDDATSSSSLTFNVMEVTGNSAPGFIINEDSATDTFVDAQEIWWGDASGPTHPDNPGGAGDAVADGFNVVNGSTGMVDFDNFLTERVKNIFTCQPSRNSEVSIPSTTPLGNGILALLMAFLGLGVLRGIRLYA